MSDRWPPEHVLALAGDASSAAAARRIAAASNWPSTGCDEQAVWGLCAGSGREPYQTVVELDPADSSGPAFKCSCPSRKFPCKHALGLLLLWANGHVSNSVRPQFASEWLAIRAARVASKMAATSAAAAAREVDRDAHDAADATPPAGAVRAGREAPPAPPRQVHDPARDKRQAERLQRVITGLNETNRWLADCVRGGLTATSLASYATWDEIAARLVDAQAGSLANRVKRVAGLVGSGPGWHETVLGELGTLHLLCVAGTRLNHLPEHVADSVRAALGWQTKQADVLASPPETDSWLAVGRSDTLEDRIVVRRSWLYGLTTHRWALVLSFAAYGQHLDERLLPGVRVRGDLHRYPGACELRVVPSGLVIEQPDEIDASTVLALTTSLAGACDQIGAALASVPWLERWPVFVHAAPTLVGKQWVLTDHTGSLPLAPGQALLPFVAASRGESVAFSAEWTPTGLNVLATFIQTVGDGVRAIDVGPAGGFHEKRWAS